MSTRSRRAVLRRAGGALVGAAVVGAADGPPVAAASRDGGNSADTLAAPSPVGTDGRSADDGTGAAPDGAGPPTGTPTGTDRATPRVVFEPQTADAAGRRVTVAHAVVPAGGFVTVHDGGPEGPVIGVSDYLPPGDHDDVAVPVDEDWRITRATGLTAVVNRDTDGDETFESLPEFLDRPYVADGEPVHDSAVVFSGTPMPTDTPAVPTFADTDTPLAVASPGSSPRASSGPSPGASPGASDTPPGASDGVPGFGVVAAVVAAGAGAVAARLRG